MDTVSANTVRRAAEAFDLGGRVLDVEPLGRGLINDTFLVTTDHGRAVLQCINRRAFPRPELIMQNLRALLDHAARHAQRALKLPDIHRTHAGSDFLVDADGAFWRALTYIENTRSIERIAHPQQAQAIGRVLGQFHALTHDLDPARLHTTRQRFHDTPWYFERLVTVLAGSAVNRDHADLRSCLEFAEARANRVVVLEQARRRGELQTHVIHGDPKVENVLFDAASGAAVSLIDLDTVQPGLLHYDLGDCLRSACNPAGETPSDPAQARFDLDLCRALLGGYFAETRGLLTDADLHYLPDAIRLIAFELGLRFLTDHLQGDTYFKVAWRGHNLHRARTQFELTASIEAQDGAIRALVAELARG
ncbi:MAG: phosphotransferase [Nitrospira sp.]|nr:phosphotransferase [Nitrospira sp.]